jgi:hypothetical protein
MRPFQAKVFISCGQSTTEEREAARDVKAWFVTKEYFPYVALEVNNIPDLNRQIIEELKSSDYFVFINFARYSVYANQELAVAVSLGFENRMILVNQRSAKREGIFGFMICNAEFDTSAEIVGIIEKSVGSERWDNSSSRHLRVENVRINDRPFWYQDEGRHQDRRPLYIALVDVRNSRPDIDALDCAMRLVKIESPSQGERPSADRSPLKVTGSAGAYAQKIERDSFGTFDLFGIDAKSYPDTYLLSNSDVKQSAIISTPEKHILTYEISASGFPKATAKIVLDIEERMSPPLPMAGFFPWMPSSGYATQTTVIPDDYRIASDSSELETPDPIPKIRLPKIWIADPS